MDTSTSCAGIFFPFFAFNASGINNQIYRQLETISQSSSGAILLKSATVEKRLGNQNPKYIVKSGIIPGCTFNSMGLPNDGIEKSLEYIGNLKQAMTTKQIPTKPVIASISGLSLAENIQLFTQVQHHNVADAIEVNLSCPNVVGKPIIGYDIEQIEQTLKAFSKIGGNVKIGLKLPPYLDSTMFDKVSEVLLQHNVHFISCINTVSALVIDANKESVVIKPKNGIGGLGGDFVKPVGLLNVRSFYDRLGANIDIIGVGGVRTGTDVFEYALAGAKAVQVGSAFAHEGNLIFEKINLELFSLLEKKGYNSITEVIGKLKYL